MADDRLALPGNVGALGRIYRAGWGLARRLPGGAAVERAVVGEARRLLSVSPEAKATPDERPVEPLRAAMAALLDRSVTDSRDTARDRYFAAIARQLLPDEARIVAALSDGTVYPLVHVGVRATLGGTHRLVLRNASSVGREAGVAQPGLTPLYVTRLIGFGVAEVGEEDPALGVQYELLLTDDRVREAERRVRGQGRVGVRAVRLTLRLSELGAQFWAAADPSARGL